MRRVFHPLVTSPRRNDDAFPSRGILELVPPPSRSEHASAGECIKEPAHTRRKEAPETDREETIQEPNNPSSEQAIEQETARIKP